MDLTRRSLFSFRLGRHKADEVIVPPKPIESSGFSRRRFLQFLGAAPVAVKLGVLDAFNPHRVYFDMGRVWTPESVLTPAMLNELNELTRKLWLGAEMDTLIMNQDQNDSYVKLVRAPAGFQWGRL